MKLNELKNLDLQEVMDTLNTLDPENVGSWPLPVKLFIYVLVFVAVLAAGYGFMLSGKRDTIALGKQAQETLLGEYEAKNFKAQNLDTYKQQLKEMEDSFGALLRQLPADTEVPGLLEDISHTGIGSGLEFDSIGLGQEASKDFYAELPIEIQVHGDYHAFGAFVSGVSALPRIVTLHDFSVAPTATSRFKDGGSPVLTMKITAKTYRYSEAGDKAADKDQVADKKKAKSAGKKEAAK